MFSRPIPGIIIHTIKNELNTHLEMQVVGVIVLDNQDNIIARFQDIYPLTAEIFNWNFHSPKCASRYFHLQFQVSEKYSDLTKGRSTFFQTSLIDAKFHL